MTELSAPWRASQPDAVRGSRPSARDRSRGDRVRVPDAVQLQDDLGADTGSPLELVHRRLQSLPPLRALLHLCRHRHRHPNNDSPYSWAWFDLRREPVVLRVPEVAEDRYYVVQMFDLFTYNFAYIGVRSTGFEAGDYLIAPTIWAGDIPRRDQRRAADRDPARWHAHRALWRRRHAQRESHPTRLRHPADLRVRRAATSATGPTAGVSRLG